MQFADFVISWWERVEYWDRIDSEQRVVVVCAECAEQFVPWAIVQEAADNGVEDWGGVHIQQAYNDGEGDACQFCVGE